MTFLHFFSFKCIKNLCCPCRKISQGHSMVIIPIHIVCLFVLRLDVPVNNFSVMSGRSQLYCRELMCLAQGHNTVTLVGIEPFGVRRSTTTPPCSLKTHCSTRVIDATCQDLTMIFISYYCSCCCTVWRP